MAAQQAAPLTAALSAAAAAAPAADAPASVAPAAAAPAAPTASTHARRTHARHTQTRRSRAMPNHATPTEAVIAATAAAAAAAATIARAGRHVEPTPRSFMREWSNYLPRFAPTGGYPEEMFINIEAEEKEKYMCNICLQIARDGTKCSNKHLFCQSCIDRWQQGINVNRLGCPVCRVKGAYKRASVENKYLKEKLVKCPAKACSWAGILQDYRYHDKEHNKGENSPRATDVNYSTLTQDPTRAQDIQTFYDHLFAVIDAISDDEEDAAGQQLENISRQLDNHRSRISHFAHELHEQSQRYQDLMGDQDDILDPDTNTRLTVEEMLNESRLARLTLDDVDEPHFGPTGSYVPPRPVDLNTNDRQRLEALMDDDSPHDNPFTVYHTGGARTCPARASRSAYSLSVGADDRIPTQLFALLRGEIGQEQIDAQNRAFDNRNDSGSERPVAHVTYAQPEAAASHHRSSRPRNGENHHGSSRPRDGERGASQSQGGAS